MTTDEFIQELELQARLMTSVATGQARIEDVDDEYLERRRKVISELKARGMSDFNPHVRLWDWHSYWKKNGLATYQARREYISQMFNPVIEEVWASQNDTNTDTDGLDDLLPIFRRRRFDADFSYQVAQAREAGQLISLIFADLDKFKAVNDTHGHPIGDAVLIRAAEIIRDTVAGRGRVYRLSGEEIGIVLENHTADEAALLAERLRTSIESQPMTTLSLPITMSFGIAAVPTHANDADNLLKRADEAMYDAKNLGRNLVRIFGEPAPTPSPLPKQSRKQPESGRLSEDMVDAIRRNFFQSGFARCPFDSAQLEIHPAYVDGSVAPDLFIGCPMCGLEEHLPKPG